MKVQTVYYDGRGKGNYGEGSDHTRKWKRKKKGKKSVLQILQIMVSHAKTGNKKKMSPFSNASISWASFCSSWAGYLSETWQTWMAGSIGTFPVCTFMHLKHFFLTFILIKFILRKLCNTIKTPDSYIPVL